MKFVVSFILFLSSFIPAIDSAMATTGTVSLAEFRAVQLKDTKAHTEREFDTRGRTEFYSPASHRWNKSYPQPNGLRTVVWYSNRRVFDGDDLVTGWHVARKVRNVQFNNG